MQLRHSDKESCLPSPGTNIPSVCHELRGFIYYMTHSKLLQSCRSQEFSDQWLFTLFRYRNPSWWRRRTALEKVLTLITIVCGIAVVALLISLLSVLLSDQANEGECLDVLCVVFLCGLRSLHWSFRIKCRDICNAFERFYAGEKVSSITIRISLWSTSIDEHRRRG